MFGLTKLGRFGLSVAVVIGAAWGCGGGDRQAAAKAIMQGLERRTKRVDKPMAGPLKLEAQLAKVDQLPHRVEQ